jgi:hypothetical protein
MSDWGVKPRSSPPTLDTFVGGLEERKGKRGAGDLKRLNAMIPAELHRRMKVACVQAGTDMTTVLIELLEKRFPPER